MLQGRKIAELILPCSGNLLDSYNQKPVLSKAEVCILSKNKGEASWSIVCLHRDLRSDLPRPYAPLKFKEDTEVSSINGTACHPLQSQI